ncbi:hypothetical protein OIDMADRAFT_61872 [Oidiodendron maius Zn]|uniref:Uncharacterized protein n=1 Tax=Oidiodendron maius (strain Zn) TaxID=913774 RepID=A0A0C3GAL6_OIDMZ|nr:hypothetical protein OIDMADRAFT_61872 [Oidiodendron maius Zn]
MKPINRLATHLVRERGVALQGLPLASTASGDRADPRKSSSCQAGKSPQEDSTVPYHTVPYH